MNRKGLVPALVIPLALGILILVLGLVFGFAVLLSTKYMLYLIGGGIIVLTLMWGLRGEMNAQKQRFMVMMVLLGVVFLILPISGLIQQTSFTTASGKVVQLAIPHYGSFECKEYPDRVGLTANVPATTSGLLISKQTVGLYTPSIKNIRLSGSVPPVSSDWTYKVSYQTCDVNGNNCGPLTSTTYYTWGGFNIPVTSINLEQQSLRVIFEKYPLVWYIFGGYVPAEGLQVIYDVTPSSSPIVSSTLSAAWGLVSTAYLSLLCFTMR